MGNQDIFPAILHLGTRWLFASNPCRFTPGSTAPNVHKTGECVGLTDSLDFCKSEKLLVPVPNRTKYPGSFSKHPRRYTERPIPPPYGTALSTKICRRPYVLGRGVSYALANIQLNFLGKYPRYYKESFVNFLFVYEASFRRSANFLLASTVRLQIRSCNPDRGKILNITFSKMTGL